MAERLLRSAIRCGTDVLCGGGGIHGVLHSEKWILKAGAFVGGVQLLVLGRVVIKGYVFVLGGDFMVVPSVKCFDFNYVQWAPDAWSSSFRRVTSCSCWQVSRFLVSRLV